MLSRFQVLLPCEAAETSQIHYIAAEKLGSAWEREKGAHGANCFQRLTVFETLCGRHLYDSKVENDEIVS